MTRCCSTGLLISLLSAVLCGCPQESGEPRRYVIEVRNLSNQPLSPVVLSAHKASVALWEEGQLAGPGIGGLAESGELTILKNQGPPPKYPNLFKVNLDALGVKPTAPKPSFNHQETSTEPSALPTAISSGQSAKKKTTPISLPAWLKDCEVTGVDPIPENDPVFEFAEDAGIPLELISLAWSEFKVRHGDGSKRQKDWRATFRNAVRGNWYRIWFVGNDGQVQITSQGRTLQAVHREAAA